MRRIRLLLALVPVLLAAPARGEEPPSLTQAAHAWLTALTDAQRTQARFPFDHPERRVWHYVPRARRGVPFGAMNPVARERAAALGAVALGRTGWSKARDVFRLEAVLGRDAGRYHVTVFGEPAKGRLWGLRFEGHHLSANLTCRGDTIVSRTPFFLGANPARVRMQDGTLLRPLAEQEDLGVALVRALDAGQRRRAVAGLRPLGDVLYGPSRRPVPTGQGLPVSAMTTAQRRMLDALVRSWTSLTPGDTPAGDLRFLWMGSTAAEGDRYYRVEGPTLLLEFRNLQNHVHMVRRDPRGDFGR